MNRNSWMWCRLLLLVGVALAGCSGGGPAGPSATAVIPTEVVSDDDVPTPVDATATPVPAAPDEAEVSGLVAFETSTAAVGDSVDAILSIGEVEDLYGAQARLTFDAELLEAVDLDDGRDGVQLADGDLLAVEYTVLNAADNDTGTINYAVSQMPPSSGVKGSGTLLRIRFRARATGMATLQVDELVLASSEGNAIPVRLEPTSAELDIQ